MEILHDFLVQWQPFFAAIAGVAANLAGLLFVALSINRDNITSQKNQIFFRVARRCFSDLIFVLIIALVFLMPYWGSFYLTVPLSLIAAFRAIYLGLTLVRYRKLKAENPTTVRAVREYALQIVSLVCLIGASVQVYLTSRRVMQWIVPVIFLLLYSASMNAWRLLLMEKNADKPAD
jgi:hypothetical protein